MDWCSKMAFVERLVVLYAIRCRRAWRKFFIDACSYKVADEAARERIRSKKLAIVEKYGAIADMRLYDMVFEKAKRTGAQF